MRCMMMIGACLLLVACGGSPSDPEEPVEERETAFDPMTESIDRAKAVEDIGQDRKKAMDEALEEAERAAPD